MEFIYKFLLLSVCMLAAQCEVLTYGNGDVHAGFEVVCNDTHIRVNFNKTDLESRTMADGSNHRPYTIAWKGQKGVPGCFIDKDNTTNHDDRLTGASNDDHMWMHASYPSECGVTEWQSDDYIIYNQTIVVTYGYNPTKFIRREEYDYYVVSCLRNRTVEKEIEDKAFNVSYRTEGKEEKNNTADFMFEFTHTDASNAAQTQYKLGDFVKFKLETKSAGSTIKTVIQRCWTTSDGSNDEYKLIDNRCLLDTGSKSLSGAPKVTTWETEAFRYLGKSNSAVYVECLVRVCLSNDPSPASECQFCAKRKRRDVSGEQSTGEMALVKSPIFYIVDREPATTSNQSSDSFLSGTNGTIVIVLLATLVLVIAVAVIKKVFFPSVAAAKAVVA